MKISRAVEHEILERAGGLCEVCHTNGDWRGLSIHHRRPKGMGGSKHSYTAEDLALLCGKCHSQAHHLREV